MRLFALIGILILLFLPFTYTRITLESTFGDTTVNSLQGYFWINTNGDGIDTETDTFETDWIEEGSVYEAYFGKDYRPVGIIILALLFVGLAFAVLDSDSKKSAYILLICGIALFALRFLELSDNDTFFYDSEEALGITLTYLEVPVGFIASLIFGLIDRGKN
ncbi:MAG: hypothetical protein GPJ54_20945 [Candidatus Heimdallarchaeota archaeon]|nr:hypothetical protein [Candidatus Heimdallarchaeota archaeon]